MAYTRKIATLHRKDADLIFYHYTIRFYSLLESIADFHSADELLAITAELAVFKRFLDTLPESREKQLLQLQTGESDDHFKLLQCDARLCLHRIAEMEHFWRA